mmetsp:Transcript_30440/g.76549  ORF Transcript_30440/g.76549 Transcript_30440/m.76549 type:complete len:192 (-) Transcript_30440:890-1465(-)
MQISKVQRRLASSILQCGKRKIWMDPNEINEISLSDKRKTVRKLIQDGIILKKNPKLHSKIRKKFHKEARQKGKHTGIGKRKGTSNARSAESVKWHFKQKVFRHLLKKYRTSEKIDRYLYRQLYLKSKGNAFKNKRVLLDYIHSAKSEYIRKKIKNERQLARHNKKTAIVKNRIYKFQDKMEKIYQDKKKI